MKKVVSLLPDNSI